MYQENAMGVSKHNPFLTAKIMSFTLQSVLLPYILVEFNQIKFW